MTTPDRREPPRSEGGGLRRATSVDVARAAGVSRATVSYVLNDTPHHRIPAETRDRVWQAVRQLNYAPSAAARALRSGKSDVVLWLMPDWPTSETTARAIDQLTAALRRAGFTLVVHWRNPDSGPLSEVWQSITPVAVLLWEPLDTDESAALRAAGTDVVLTLTGADPAATNTVGMDAALRQTGRLQVEHLAELGHRRIGYALPEDPHVMSFAEPRLAGVRAACADLGLDAPDCQIVGLDVGRATTAVDQWRHHPGGPVTAVCTFNDDVALAVLAGMRATGLRAPADLAVVGVDNLDIAHLADPPLTTVFLDSRILVDYIVQAVLAGLNGTTPPQAPGATLAKMARRESA